MGIEAKVAAILNERELVINRGAASGITEGMKFKVMESDLLVVDPDTKTSLGSISRAKIRIRIAEVQPNFAIGRTYEAYQTHVATPLPALAPLFGGPVTRMRTLRTEGPGKFDEGSAYVQVGDIVVETEEV